MAIKATIKLGKQQPTQAALELKNNPAALKINNMASLADVDATDQVDGGVLVYSNTTHTYVVRRIDDGTF